MIGRPIINYPADRRAPEGEGCETCGIVLEADAIGNHCSPECCEWAAKGDLKMAEPYWRKSVRIDASRTEHGCVDFSIDMGPTGPIMTMSIGDERVVVASRWNVYTTDQGTKQLSAAFEEGLKFLRVMK